MTGKIFILTNKNHFPDKFLKSEYGINNYMYGYYNYVRMYICD